MLSEHRPDLVLCDITMPGLGGYDVLKAMREKGGLADVPFIFLTALADETTCWWGSRPGPTITWSNRSITRFSSPPWRRASTRSLVCKRARSERAEEAWQEVLTFSRGRTVEALYKATFAFDRFLVGVVVVDEFRLGTPDEQGSRDASSPSRMGSASSAESSRALHQSRTPSCMRG